MHMRQSTETLLPITLSYLHFLLCLFICLFLQKKTSLALFPQMAGLLQHLLKSAADVLSYCCGKRYTMVCWGGGLKKDASQLTKLMKKVGHVVCRQSVIHGRITWTMDNPLHPLYDIISRQMSSFSDRLLALPSSGH